MNGGELMKKKICFAAALAIAITTVFAYFMILPASLTGKVVSFEPDEIYPMFLCPCCGQPLDKENICCGMAEEMIDYIDAQIAAGLSGNDVIIKTAERFGINSVIEPERERIAAELARRNPGLPDEKISFSSAVGEKAPDFTLESIEGSVKLSDYLGKNIVLFFNEGSMCYPACWNQMAELGSDERLNNDDTVSFSIVTDQKSEWKSIISRVPKLSEAKILFDTTRTVSSSYDVLNLKSSMHPGSYPGHTYFVIDKQGVIRYTLDDPKMAIWNDRLSAELKNL